MATVQIKLNVPDRLVPLLKATWNADTDPELQTLLAKEFGGWLITRLRSQRVADGMDAAKATAEQEIQDALASAPSPA